MREGGKEGERGNQGRRERANQGGGEGGSKSGRIGGRENSRINGVKTACSKEPEVVTDSVHVHHFR